MHYNEKRSRILRFMREDERDVFTTHDVRLGYFDRWPRAALSINEIGNLLTSTPGVIRLNHQSEYPAMWGLSDDRLGVQG